MSGQIPADNDFFQKLVQSSMDGILAFDTACRYTIWNPGMERISGVAEKEVLGKVAFEVFPFLKETGEDRHFELALNGVASISQDRPYSIPQTGTQGFYEGRYSPMHDATGKIIGGLAIIRDITERKNLEQDREKLIREESARREAEQARELLRKSEERYRVFIEQSSEAIWRFELEKPIPISLPEDEVIHLCYQHAYLAECNQKMAEMYDFQNPSEILGARLQELLPRSDPHNEEFLRRFIRSGFRLNDAQTHEVDRNGKPKVFLNNLLGIIENQCIVRAWGVQRDITERNILEQTLQLQARVLQCMREGVSISDENGIILYTNPAEDVMFGYATGELIGKHVTIQNTYPAEENIRIVNEVMKQLQQTGSWLGEFSNRKKDGTPFVTHAYITALEAGDRKYLVCVQEDITHRKKAEETLKSLNQFLEKRVEERTLELKEANTEMEAFTYTVAHDLRAPVRAMHGFSQLLYSEYGSQMSAEAADYLSRIHKASARMEALISGLLTYSRASRQSIELLPLPLEEVIDDVLLQMDAILKSRKASVIIEPPLPQVLAHQLALTQVLENLISNATKFQPPEQNPRVRIWAEVIDNTARLNVQDNGIGIRPEHQDRIFRVFERLHGNNTFEGTGIGLAIVRKCMERMKGTVGVNSEPGKGSTFWIELPLARQT